jgi:hypothetical protein
LSVAFPAGLANAEPVGEGALKFGNGVVWHLLAFVGIYWHLLANCRPDFREWNCPARRPNNSTNIIRLASLLRPRTL